MRRSRIGLLVSAVMLVIVGGLPPVAAAAPSPSPGTHHDMHHEMLEGILHGEGVVQTKKGPVQVAMQNGEATALTQSSLTVRSADGFTRTWTLDDNVRVYDKRNTLQPNALKSGADLVVAGTAATAGSYVARIVLVHSS